jgi:sarcosine oxidase
MITPHVLVVGLGITGSSIAATLAAAGIRVTAFEQFVPLHERGSSHGDTRIYRRVPHEGPAYVDLATVSWDGWRQWGTMAGEDLLVTCGGFDAGPPHSEIARSAKALSDQHGFACELLSGAAFNKTNPKLNLPPDWEVAFQPQSGYVRPDATRTFLHKMARSAGATLRHETRVDIEYPAGGGVAVRAGEETVQGDILIVAAGSWLPRLMPELDLRLSTERRVLAWFEPKQPSASGGLDMPIFLLDADGGWYGMPTPDGRLKIGHDKHLGETIDPDRPLREPGAVDAAKLVPCIERYFQGFATEPSAMKSCIYTITPDHHFIIDRPPDRDNVILFSCCSGHGFKFAPAYGKFALDLVTGKRQAGFDSGGQSITRYYE